ncbi:MAG: hypothetical protein JETCAE02_01130 [Anaerolineaceae bacterium]|nr:hypothetical protein [Anaerolineae bacterium]MBL1171565.1 hypothetical protein [Chloroflexota bacterium]NOG75028.1 hypothetical protein [Chloroflexota bacterium]GJQ37701.1 MAG: hypothetical protein JETCAE02_01130 [Anaerolineaceae bacterium]
MPLHDSALPDIRQLNAGLGLAFSKSEDFHRECREFANPGAALAGRCDAKKPMKIRPYALFAFHIGQLVKRLCYGHRRLRP